MHLPLFLEFEPRISRCLDEATLGVIRAFVQQFIEALGRPSHFLCRLRSYGDDGEYVKVYEKRDFRSPRVCILHIHPRTLQVYDAELTVLLTTLLTSSI